jgi:formamidopyrimidine-DNA glycosylase
VPELPEVETVRRTLAPIVGARLASVWTSGKGLHMARRPPRAALQRLVGARITALRRHGKYLLVDTSMSSSILFHLGMSGRLRVQRADAPRARHTHVVLGLGARELHYVDPRRFGQCDVFERASPRDHDGLALLGPDPLVDGVDAAELHDAARNRKVTLKAFVLDQGVLAGMGNIYASEALWRAKLRPSRRSNRLSAAAAGNLAEAIREVLDRALVNNGTSLRDFVDADGAEGSNADYLWVYGREGEPCPRCNRAIRRTVHQGRATFYCPTCQPP